MEDRKFLADVHIHSEYSHDSVCPVSEIVNTAREKGMDLVCITDHCDLYSDENPEEVVAQRKEMFQSTKQDIPQDSGVEVLVGVELGAGFLFPELAQKIVDAISFDVVIGSVHGIIFRGQRTSTSKFDFGALDDASLLEYLTCYMEDTAYIAEKLDVDVLGHLTYFLRYINGKYKRNLDWRVLEKSIRRIHCALIKRNIALEINTSCVGSDYDEWLPAREIVDLYIEMGGKLFTLGSDAHKSKYMTHGFDAVKDYLREKGITQLVYYKNRKPHYYSI